MSEREIDDVISPAPDKLASGTQRVLEAMGRARDYQNREPPRVPARIPTPALNKALAAAQKRAQAVEKDAQNTFHKYKYASAEAIIAEAREALSAEGLAVFPLSIDRDPAALDHRWGGEGESAYIDVPRRVRATYLLLHESGEEREFYSTVPVIPEKGRPEDKAEFGSRTENLGYALRDLLLLPRVQEGAVQPSGRDDTRDQGPRPAQRREQTPARASAPDPDPLHLERIDRCRKCIRNELKWGIKKATAFISEHTGVDMLEKVPPEKSQALWDALVAEVDKAQPGAAA